MLLTRAYIILMSVAALCCGTGPIATASNARFPNLCHSVQVESDSAADDTFRVNAKLAGPLGTHVLRKVTPDYPQALRDQGIQGDVTLKITVSKTGKVTKAIATDGPEALRPLTEVAARKWVFRPLALATGPVRFITSITFSFVLDNAVHSTTRPN